MLAAALASKSGYAKAGSKPCMLPCPHVSASPGGPSPADPRAFFSDLGKEAKGVQPQLLLFLDLLPKCPPRKSFTVLGDLARVRPLPPGPAAGPQAAAQQEEGSWKLGPRAEGESWMPANSLEEAHSDLRSACSFCIFSSFSIFC